MTKPLSDMTDGELIAARDDADRRATNAPIISVLAMWREMFCHVDAELARRQEKK